MAAATPRNTSSVREKVQQQARHTAVAERKPDPTVTLRATLERMKPQIQAALPKHMTADRLARIVMTQVRLNPKLLECSTESLLAAVMQSAQLGLEPGILGHCYFVPFWNDRRKEYEVQFIVGYRGMIDLARRSGHIETIYAQIVYENDKFELEYGLEPRLSHIPWHVRNDATFETSGGIRGAYMVAKFTGGGYYLHYMPKAEIDKHRDRSAARNNGPWVTDYEEMAKKTVVRAGWKWLPISIEIARQVEAADESVKEEIASDMADVINLAAEDYQTVDEGTPATNGAAEADQQPEPEAQPAQAAATESGSLF